MHRLASDSLDEEKGLLDAFGYRCASLPSDPPCPRNEESGWPSEVVRPPFSRLRHVVQVSDPDAEEVFRPTEFIRCPFVWPCGRVGCVSGDVPDILVVMGRIFGDGCVGEMSSRYSSKKLFTISCSSQPTP